MEEVEDFTVSKQLCQWDMSILKNPVLPDNEDSHGSRTEPDSASEKCQCQ
jgi:hypothetical protein